MLGDSDHKVGEGKQPPEDSSVIEDKEASSSVPDTGLTCLVMLLKFLGKAAEPEQIRHQRGKGNDPFEIDDLYWLASKLK